MRYNHKWFDNKDIALRLNRKIRLLQRIVVLWLVFHTTNLISLAYVNKIQGKFIIATAFNMNLEKILRLIYLEIKICKFDIPKGPFIQ